MGERTGKVSLLVKGSLMRGARIAVVMDEAEMMGKMPRRSNLEERGGFPPKGKP